MGRWGGGSSPLQRACSCELPADWRRERCARGTPPGTLRPGGQWRVSRRPFGRDSCPLSWAQTPGQRPSRATAQPAASASCSVTPDQATLELLLGLGWPGHQEGSKPQDAAPTPICSGRMALTGGRLLSSPRATGVRKTGVTARGGWEYAPSLSAPSLLPSSALPNLPHLNPEVPCPSQMTSRRQGRSNSLLTSCPRHSSGT